jgi:hypothetical protein
MQSTYVVSTWLFQRALGLIYCAAFASLAVQIKGLIGRNGILPAEAFLESARVRLGRRRFFTLPTLCWWRATDGFLQFLCWSGVALSLLLAAGFLPVPTLILLWLSYLSLLNTCGVFLGYQWDVLLLETGFLSIWLAPVDVAFDWPPSVAPNRMALWLAWWLLFRLMFSSGAVKLRSGDPTWRRMTALIYHYETQPLPTPLAWHAHQLPKSVHEFCCAAMFVIELGVPFLFVAPPPICYIAALLTIGLMLLIMATGNYCFFNLLTIALCLLVFDDSLFQGFPKAVVTASGWSSWWVVPPSLLLLALSIRPVAHLFVQDVPWPRTLQALAGWLEPFHLVNSYGLFAVMTTTRNEIIIEGSLDGATWKAYEFKWKPGDVRRPLRYCIPHQPRLDWQMWFAALGAFDEWFVTLLARLLENTEPVVTLLRNNPFPDAPPKYVRALLYRYRFTDPFTLRSTGAWWHRDLMGLYCPILTRGDGMQNKIRVA